MPSKIHLVRHAQGYHNLGPEYWSLPDPLLTEEGKRQCCELGRSLPSTSAIDLIVTSPMRRAIYTGLEAFSGAFNAQSGQQLIALPSLQEISNFPCDVGSKIDDLRNEVKQGNLPVDLSCVEDGWTDKIDIYEPTMQKIQDRARQTRLWLRARPETEIVVVSHGGFLHFLAEDWEDGCKYEATGCANAESRTYEFARDKNDPGESEDAVIQETVESRKRRGKCGSPLTRDSQTKLLDMMLQGWADQGYSISLGLDDLAVDEVMVK
ncbi:phosphoglycerate mutase-like protein [Penicillium malachiteum]|nr:phosphoglycerate mutase-like protein [Penicillium malachiteum]